MENNVTAACILSQVLEITKESIMILSTTSQFAVSGNRRDVLFYRVDINLCESLLLDTAIND